MFTDMKLIPNSLGWTSAAAITSQKWKVTVFLLNTVGWSDLTLFRFLKTYTFLLIRYIFKEFNPSKNNLCTKRKLEKIICLIFIFIFQKWAELFLICTSSKYFLLNFTSFLALKKSKNTLPPVAGFKEVF